MTSRLVYARFPGIIAEKQTTEQSDRNMWTRLLPAVLAGAALLGSAPLSAQEAAAPQDFTFKRIRPPAPGTTQRITIQIAPAPGVGETATPQDVVLDVPDQATARVQRSDWFWDVVTPALEPPEDGKWIEAVAQAEEAPPGALSAPSLELLNQIIEKHGRDILRESVQNQISPALILSVIAVESAGKADAVSSAGAQGLMQLIPATADRFEVEDPFDAAQNIRGGTAYLAWLMETFWNDPVLSLAAYNAGENALRAHGGVPPFAETRGYVPKVLAAWNVARLLCSTPPELHSDGCVFAVNQ